MYILLLLFEEKGILVCFFFFAVTQSHTAGVLHGQTLRAMLLLQLPTPAQLESVFVCGEGKKKKKTFGERVSVAASRRKLVSSPRGYFYLQHPCRHGVR